MQTIQTRVFPPTNTKPMRLRAQTSSGVKGPYFCYHSLDGEDADRKHQFVAQALALQLKWPGRWFGGDDGVGMTFVCADPHRSPEFTVPRG